MRRSKQGLAGQPALLGAVTVFIAIVAIYFVYQADSGLPFVPTYDVQAELPNAEHLGKTGDVRMAGVLVGRVGERELVTDPDGSTHAVLELRLYKEIEPLPADSQVAMRAVSSLGWSYVELLPGKSEQPLRGNPPRIVSEHPTEDISLSDSLEAYDERTRGALGRYLGGAGDSVATRGPEINDVIALAPQTFRHLEGAARTLASPHSDLGGFIRGFARFNEALSPVAHEQAGFFRGLDLTFGSLAAARSDVAAATAEAPAMFEAGIRGLPRQRTLVRETKRLFAAMRPGIHALRGAADHIEAASVRSPAAFRSLTSFAPRTGARGPRAQPLLHRPRGAARPAHAHLHLPRAAAAGGLARAQPDRVQLPRRGAPQPGQRAERGDDHRQLHRGRRRAGAAGRERRGRPGIEARRRPVEGAPGQPPALHGHAGHGRGREPRVRAGQRDLRDRKDGGRPRARQAARRDREDGAGEAEVSFRHRRAARSKRTDPIAGIAALLIACVCVYWAFARPEPFKQSFQVKVMLTSTTGVKPKFTPVRIAGVDVGEVSAVQSFEGTKTALVTLELEESAPPIHADARVKMRPRLFLEGNSFIDLEPGTPNAAAAEEGMTIPLERSSVYVSFPHVLRALGSDTRGNLQDTLDEYGESLNSEPTAAEDATQDPAVRGLTGGEALNGALHHAAKAMPTIAQLSDATRGRRDGDLERAIDGFGRTAEALNESGELGRDAGERAARQLGVRPGGKLGNRHARGAARRAGEQRTGAARAAWRPAPAEQLAVATLDALPALPGALDSGVPWLGQMRRLLGPDELGGDLDSLLPATRDLAPALSPTTDLLRELDLLSRCSTKVLIPTANARIEDGTRSSGTSSWSEFLSAAVGANGSAQNFDGNGFLLRGQPGGSDAAVATSKTRWMGEPAYGNALARPEGTRPAEPSALPPHEPGRALPPERGARLERPRLGARPARREWAMTKLRRQTRNLAALVRAGRGGRGVRRLHRGPPERASSRAGCL